MAPYNLKVEILLHVLDYSGLGKFFSYYGFRVHIRDPCGVNNLSSSCSTACFMANSYTQLPIGVASASAIFQQTMDTVLQGLSNVMCVGSPK